jgi:hypothetical protein
VILLRLTGISVREVHRQETVWYQEIRIRPRLLGATQIAGYRIGDTLALFSPGRKSKGQVKTSCPTGPAFDRTFTSTTY